MICSLTSFGQSFPVRLSGTVLPGAGGFVEYGLCGFHKSDHIHSRRRVLPIVPFCHGSEECRFSAIGVGRARAERASRVEAYPLVEEGATPPTSAPRGVEQEQFYRNAARGVNPAKHRKRRSHTFPQIGPQGARSAAYDRRKAGRGERRRREAPRAGLAKSRTGVVG